MPRKVTITINYIYIHLHGLSYVSGFIKLRVGSSLNWLKILE